MKSAIGQMQMEDMSQLFSPVSGCLRVDFEEIFNGQLFADVELVVDGKLLKAHKSVLAGKFVSSKFVFPPLNK